MSQAHTCNTTIFKGWRFLEGLVTWWTTTTSPKCGRGFAGWYLGDTASMHVRDPPTCVRPLFRWKPNIGYESCGSYFDNSNPPFCKSIALRIIARINGLSRSLLWQVCSNGRRQKLASLIRVHPKNGRSRASCQCSEVLDCKHGKTTEACRLSTPNAQINLMWPKLQAQTRRYWATFTLCGCGPEKSKVKTGKCLLPLILWW